MRGDVALVFRLCLLSLWLASCGCLGARVLINEVCCNPAGADDHKEWIELYNSGGQDVNLAGAKILRGGSQFAEVYEFPSFVLRAGRYLLLGESQVEQAQLTAANLDLQNATSETDGVRYLSPDGGYTDTVVYGQPNINALPDDSGQPAVSFAPKCPDGYSLVRLPNGTDTDDCGLDFCLEALPSPGLPNPVRADFALLHVQLWQESGEWLLDCWVKNLSAHPPQQTATLRTLLDGVQVGQENITFLTAGDSLYFMNFLPVQDEQNHLVELILDLPGDPVPENNRFSCNLLQQETGNVRLNELMYDPAPGTPEWIEIWQPGSASRADYLLRDAGDNHFSFSLPPEEGYYVLCGSAKDFLAAWPDCPDSALVEVNGWTPLNNTGDSLYLYAADEVLVDQMSYAGQSAPRGKSLELDPQNAGLWRPCLDGSGTPGRANSVAPPAPEFSGSLKLIGSPCDPRSGERIELFYQLQSPSNHVSCSVFDRAGNRVRVLADNISLGASGSLAWDGRSSGGKLLPRGVYLLLWESRPASGGKLLRRQLSCVLL